MFDCMLLLLCCVSRWYVLFLLCCVVFIRVVLCVACFVIVLHVFVCFCCGLFRSDLLPVVCYLSLVLPCFKLFGLCFDGLLRCVLLLWCVCFVLSLRALCCLHSLCFFFNVLLKSRLGIDVDLTDGIGLVIDQVNEGSSPLLAAFGPFWVQPGFTFEALRAIHGLCKLRIAPLTVCPIFVAFVLLGALAGISPASRPICIQSGLISRTKTMFCFVCVCVCV